MIDKARSGSRSSLTGPIALALFICLSGLYACTAEITESDTVVRDGMIYKKGEDRPFSGIVTGKGREEYRQEVCRFEKQYENGILNGRSHFWYGNGKLESVVPYKDGEIHGVVTRYHSNGKIKARIHFENGFRGGNKGEFFWDEEGAPIKG